MAQRERPKVKRVSPRTAPSPAVSADALERLEARAKVLERERDGLKAELEAAHARITSLEETRSQAVHRIDWVIDSLHNIVGKSA
jgi:sugar-specific transcriptional regulator TrmB